MSVPNDFCKVTSDKGTVYQFSLQSTDESNYKPIASRFNLMEYSSKADQIKLAPEFILASADLFSLDGHYIKAKNYNKIIVLIERDEIMYLGGSLENRVLNEAKSVFSRLKHNMIRCEGIGEDLYVYLKYS